MENLTNTFEEMIRQMVILKPKDWLIKLHCLYKEFHSLNISPEDCVLDETTARIYLQRGLWGFSYKFFLLGFTIYFLLFMNSATVFSRFIYVSLILYASLKLRWLIPKMSLSCLQIWGLIDISILSFICAFTIPSDTIEAIILNVFVYTCFLYLSSSYILNIATAIFFAFVICSTLSFTSQSFLTGTAFFALFYFMTSLKHVNDDVSNELILKTQAALHNAELALQNKNIYVSCVTHDLKNPLNSILGTIDFLKNSQSFKQEDDKNMLLTASYSGQILLYLIGNILDAAKIEAGRFDIDRIPMNIAEEITKISKIEQEIAKPKGLSLYKKFLNPLPKLVFGDPMRFTQILINIIGNAIKFTSLGYVAIVTRWAKDAQEAKEGYLDNKMRIIKTETDAIIPEEDFFQTDIGTKKGCLRPLTPKISQIKKEDPKGECDTFEEDVNENLEEFVYQRLQRYSQNYIGKELYQATELAPIITVQSEKKEKRGSIDIEVLKGYGEEYSSTNLSSYLSGIFGDSGFLVIEIIDTGPGMTQEEQKKLFQPFAQANSAVKRKFGGTGLGLWITKQLVNLMCGLIEVRSQPKVGTVFQITIPFKVVEAEESPKLREESKRARPLSQLNPFSTFLNSTPDPVTHFRTSGRFECKGSNPTLKGLKILILEEGLLADESKLEQVMKQLSSHTCELYHSIYSSGPLVIKNADFRVVVILAGASVIAVKKEIPLLQKALKEKNAPSVPLVVVSGINLKIIMR